MSTLERRLTLRLGQILSEDQHTDWKDPHSPNYDRQWAEDALYHTIGPLTDNPRWYTDWTSPSEPVPGFVPGGPAPRWTPEEVVMAFAGDPQLLFRGLDNPRSPAYGNKGGSPLYRTARRVARIYNRDRDRSFIADLFSNGFIPLVRMMQPGFDESRSPFISYVIRYIQGAMEHGVGGTEQAIRAKGAESTEGVTGLEGMLAETNPQKVEELANQVKGDFRQNRSHAKHPDNPFGGYSSRYYQVGMNYADALRSGNEEHIKAARSQIEELIDTIKDESIPVLGASTGIGQAVSTQDRTTSVGVKSLDIERRGSEGKGTLGGQLPARAEEEDFVDPGAVYYILEIALKHDIKQQIGGSQILANKLIQAGVNFGDLGGPLTATEYRYLLRELGPAVRSYPGKDQVRKNINIPREAKGWWQAGEDPEIEPIPGGAQGALWRSIWLRNEQPHLGPTEIAQEMTEEVREFTKLNIPTARKIKTKTDARSGRTIESAITKVAVSNTFQAALAKLKAIAILYREELGMEESKALLRNGFTLLEGIDATDRALLAETAESIVRRLQRTLVFA